MSEQGQQRESVGGVWKRTSRAGQEYLSLSIEGKRFVAFLNDKTDKRTGIVNDKRPDWRIFAEQERQAPAPAEDQDRIF